MARDCCNLVPRVSYLAVPWSERREGKMRDPGNEVGIVVALCPTEHYVRGLSKQMRQCIFDGITQVLVTKSFMPHGACCAWSKIVELHSFCCSLTYAH